MILCAPALNAALVSVAVPAAQVTALPVAVTLSRNCTLEPVTQLTVKEGVVLLVISSVLLEPLSVPAVMSGVPGAASAVVSIVTERLDEAVLALPAESVWIALILCAPVPRVAAVSVTVPAAHVPAVPVALAPS